MKIAAEMKKFRRLDGAPADQRLSTEPRCIGARVRSSGPIPPVVSLKNRARVNGIQQRGSDIPTLQKWDILTLRLHPKVAESILWNYEISR